MIREIGLVQRSDAMPLYNQIFLSLRDDIVSGSIPFGATVPSESELSQMYGVSRITSQRALRELSKKGFVERRRRSGTRVVYHAEAEAPVNSGRTIDSAIHFAKQTSLQVVELAEGRSTPKQAEDLELDVGSPIVHIVRLRSFGSTPLGLIDSILPAAAATMLDSRNLADAPLSELLQAAGHTVNHGYKVVTAAAATPACAARLGLEPRAAMIRIERLLRDQNSAPLALTVAHYRGDKYQLPLAVDAVPYPVLD